MLICGNFMLHKVQQPKHLQKDYSKEFDLD
jgi:hypothetical protein